jgi:imidazolonepropionase-like amidohydrolase
MRAGSRSAVARDLAFVGARVVDGTGSSARANVTVVVRNGLITTVGESDPPADCHVIDLAGRTLLPGLIDAHAHVSSLGNVPDELRAYGLVKAMSDLLEAGITTVRDLGAYCDSLWRLRDAALLGLCRAPRLVLCGQVISATCAGAKSFPGMYREANGVAEIRRAVREQASAGADVIKVMSTGALTVPGEDIGPPQLRREEMVALVEEAHRLGLPVAAHAEGADGIRFSVEAGADTIEHGEEGHLVPDALATMAERGTILVPTLSVFDYVAESDAYPGWMRDRARRLGESARLTIQAARKEGVAIAMGADAPPQGANAQELVRLTDAGLTGLEALTAATGISARACGVDGLVGTVEPGKKADLVVVDGDPLSDLAILSAPRRLWLVLQDGVATAGYGALRCPDIS